MLQSGRLADGGRSRPTSANTTDLPPSTNSQCGRLKREALIRIEEAFQSDGHFKVKRGNQDWGFLRDEQETQDCTDQNCLPAFLSPHPICSPQDLGIGP
eukprot:scaffold18868_cov18-Tisochrysis_lutea.AAC.1